MPILLVQPAPATLPDAMVRDLVKALREATTEGRPLGSTWGSALSEMERMLRKRPEGDAERTFLQGLKAVAAGKAGERGWGLAARSLQQQLRQQGGGSLEAERLWAHLADLQAAQGLPDYPWRDRALASRLERSRGVDAALETAVLASLKDHWGGFLEPPRREQTLARSRDLLGLWLRRSDQERAKVMARTAFENHAGPLWAFAAREGDEDLKSRLQESLRDLPPEVLLEGLDEKSFLPWISSLRESPLAEAVRTLVLALDPLMEARWGFRSRAALLREAGLTPLYVELLADGLERLPQEARHALLHNEVLELPKLGVDLAKRIQGLLLEEPALVADEPLRRAWVQRFSLLGFEEEATALAGGVVEAAPPVKGGKDGGPEPDAEWKAALHDSDLEIGLMRAFESGRMEAVEALLWPVLEAMARGERIGPFKDDEVATLPGVMVEPWLRRRAPEEAMLRLERLEMLLLRRGSPLPTDFTKGLPALRRRVERERRLIQLLGPAAEP